MTGYDDYDKQFMTGYDAYDKNKIFLSPQKTNFDINHNPK